VSEDAMQTIIEREKETYDVFLRNMGPESFEVQFVPGLGGGSA
jgi:hypothetical protein